MTDSEHQNPGDAPAPQPDGSSEPAVPPPSPYEQPPLPGSEPPAPYGAPYPPHQPPYGQARPPQPAQPPYGQPVYPAQQPPQPYQQQNPFAQTGQAPTGQTPPYGGGQQPPYPPYGAGPQPPVPPYPAQPYPATPQQPEKKKAWPWVLSGCLLLILLLGIGGCVSCTACTVISDVANDRYGYGNRYDYPYGYDYGDSSDSGTIGLFTLSDIEEAFDGDPGKVEDGRCTPGVFEVGKDIEPGRYYFEGSQDQEANFYVFDGEGDGSYSLGEAVVYFGNYFADLEEGDVVAFDAADDLRFYPLSQADFKPAGPPYASGLYRVGTDIPAGMYAVTVNAAAADAAEQDCAAFVMKDLDFDDDSITDTKYVAHGGSQTVTVKDGDYLELYGTTAAPAAEESAS